MIGSCSMIDTLESSGFWIERACSDGLQPVVPVEPVNALDRSTLGGLAAWIEPGNTVVLVGSSGVGKSTLINSLAEVELAATKGVREDDKRGRHTTSHACCSVFPAVGW